MSRRASRCSYGCDAPAVARGAGLRAQPADARRRPRPRRPARPRRPGAPAPAPRHRRPRRADADDRTSGDLGGHGGDADAGAHAHADSVPASGAIIAGYGVTGQLVDPADRLQALLESVAPIGTPFVEAGPAIGSGRRSGPSRA